MNQAVVSNRAGRTFRFSMNFQTSPSFSGDCCASAPMTGALLPIGVSAAFEVELHSELHDPYVGSVATGCGESVELGSCWLESSSGVFSASTQEIGVWRRISRSAQRSKDINRNDTRVARQPAISMSCGKFEVVRMTSATM